ncbi:MAG: hypothetical protein K9I99_15205 [Melioribacteraceae bacterium]|nr:hypothetical protein [Melioribacteraceae bacterium]
MTSPFGSFGFVFAVSIGILSLFTKAGQLWERFKTIGKIEAAIDKIKEDVAEIKAFIRTFRQENTAFAQRKSPLRLTERGRNVAEELKAEGIVEESWERILKKINSRIETDANPYDIQEACLEVGESYSDFLSDNQYNVIANIAFKNGNKLSDYDIIFGLVIRNKYFAEKGISLTDVDLHDPSER